MPARHLLRRIARLPANRLLLLLEAAFWLLAARIALAALPFPRIGRYIGHLQAPVAPVPCHTTDQAATAAAIARAVHAAAENSPTEMVCLPRALAAWQMLQLRQVPARLHFGMPLERQTGQGAQHSHAWLTSAGVEVTGYPVAHRCVEVGFFSREAPPVTRT